MKDILFAPGNWFNTAGPIGRHLESQFAIADLCGIPTLKSRVELIKDTLRNNPSVTTLLGHSGGCPVIAAALQHTSVRQQIKKVILMNSGPARGVKFGLTDPTFCTIPKYLWPITTGKHFMLSEHDVRKLLMTEEDEIGEMMSNLKPDSGAYVRSIVFRQYGSKAELLLFSNIKLAIVNAKEGDAMLGSTVKETTHLYRMHNPRSIEVRIGKGHMWAVQNIEEVLRVVNEKLSKI